MRATIPCAFRPWLLAGATFLALAALAAGCIDQTVYPNRSFDEPEAEDAGAADAPEDVPFEVAHD